MTPRCREYLELLDEKEWQRATSGLSRADEINFAARLDKHWNKLTEDEQEVVEAELAKLDAKK